MEDNPSTSQGMHKRQARQWKTYCCVPQCDNNSERNPELSFHKMPKSKEIKRKWVRVLKTKGLLNPRPNQKVCSEHFPDGKKTYENNVPTIFGAQSATRSRKTPTIREFKPETEVVNMRPNVDSPNEQTSYEMLPDQNSINTDLKHKLDLLQKQLNAQKADNLALQSKYDEDMEKMGECLFRIERFIGSDSDFRFYTGFPDYSTFKAFFDYLSPACNHLVYHGSNTAPITSECQAKRGKERSLSPEQELFLVLSRLRCGLLLRDLAHRFSLSESHVSRIWKTWIAFLQQRLCALPIWPSRQLVDDTMPACFKSSFPKTRVIIDCTEFLIERPSSCRSQSITFSSYKNHNTAKGLLGISPNGYPAFVSSLYAGRTSDKKITNDCGILNLLEPGDELMADRGFDIGDDLPTGVTLNIPPFLDGKPQLSVEEESVTRKIASVWVHVERAISRIKNYRILNQVIPISLSDDLDNIWTICSYLTLFLPPLIVEG